MAENYSNGLEKINHRGKKEKLLVTSNFSFSHSFIQAFWKKAPGQIGKKNTELGQNTYTLVFNWDWGQNSAPQETEKIPLI